MPSPTTTPAPRPQYDGAAISAHPRPDQERGPPRRRPRAPQRTDGPSRPAQEPLHAQRTHQGAVRHAPPSDPRRARALGANDRPDVAEAGQIVAVKPRGRLVSYFQAAAETLEPHRV